MTDPTRTEDPTRADPTEAGPGIRLLAHVGACLACCIPMLLLLGAVSVGAALAGFVGLTVLAAPVAATAALTSRRRRR